ncbi:MAG: hypothetical protein RLZZ156_880 [Deinococcota bacterium]|jgi:hypothetical protein
MKLCEIQLVINITGEDRIEDIELGINEKILSSAVNTVSAKIWLQVGYYRFLLDEPLPNFSGFTLKQIILGWQLLQSLAVVVFDSFTLSEQDNIKHLLNFAPRIARGGLVNAFARALVLDSQRAEELMNVFVFGRVHNQEVWLQPLVPYKDDFCLVIPSIHSVHLHRIVEGWMRQGGLDLDRRGPEFENFCLKEIVIAVEESPIKESIQILGKSINFTPPDERSEEIDIVVIVADTILLIEAKCILWPDESLQFANYRDTVEAAVVQITRKRDAVTRNRDSFSKRIKDLGYKAPENFTVACCVLTNSAILSGFPIATVPIIDLSILNAFFKNEHIKFELRHLGESIQKHSITFYINAKEAGDTLNTYLTHPPQLTETKKYVKSREIEFPLESSEFGKFLHEVYFVQVDVNEIRKQYDA